MRTISLPKRETSRQYLARVKAEKEFILKAERQLIRKRMNQKLLYCAFAGGMMLFGLLLYAVFCPVKG